MNRPCLTCGDISPDTRCPNHQLKKASRTHGPRPWYSSQWRRLSARARKLQPWCIDGPNGCRGQLEADHLPIAHQRQQQGLPIRLCDIAVRCHLHNVQAGQARGSNVTRTD